MAYYLPETASGQPNLTAKNRVWGFFRESGSVYLETRRPALEPHQENYAGPQETVSGFCCHSNRVISRKIVATFAEMKVGSVRALPPYEGELERKDAYKLLGTAFDQIIQQSGEEACEK